ncbi:MAG: complex I NDUFA9 subunit family protein [Rhizomicrobium sp.]
MEYPLVTVFGGSGFVGRHAVQALAEAGYRIRVAVRRPKAANFLQPLGQVGQIQIVKCDVTDAKTIAASVKNAHAVINLVGIQRQSSRQRFKTLHVEAASRIAKAAMDANAPVFVHVSALGASLTSSARFAYTKAMGEALVREAFPAATILRPSLIYGPEDKFFNRFAWLARLSPVLPLGGDGENKCQPVFVGDVARAIVKAVKDPAATRGRSYDLGGPGVYSIKDLVGLVLEQTGRKRAVLGVGLSRNKRDSVIPRGALSFDDLGITPTTVEAILPTYLWRFRSKEKLRGRAKAVAAHNRALAST